MATDALASNVGTLTSLLGLFSGSKKQETISGGGSTQQTMLSQEAVNALLKDLMENDNKGLARVASGQKAPGLYNSTSRTLLMNDLLARSTAEVEKLRSPTVTTKANETRQIATPATLGGGGLLGAGALVLASKKAREKLGIDGVFDDIKGAFTSEAGLTGITDSMTGIPSGFATNDGFAGLGTNYAPGISSVDQLAAAASGYSGADFGGAAMFSPEFLDAGTMFESADVVDMWDTVGTAADVGQFSADGVSFFDGAGGTPYGAVARAASGDVEGAAQSAAVYFAADAVVPGSGAIASMLFGGKIICTELYRQGKMDQVTYMADQKFGLLQSADVMRGYHLWASPVVALMRKSSAITYLVSLLALPWARHMSYQMGVSKEDSLLGKVLMTTGLPICKLLGKLITATTGECAHG